jgi:anti-anti-sigma regulatory factor
MLKIQRSSNGQVIFVLTGRMNAEHGAELKALFSSEAGTRQIVLDLKDLTLVDLDAVRFLESCETDGIQFKNCPPYIREWITGVRRGRQQIS